MRFSVKRGSTIASVLAAVLLVLPLYLTQPAFALAAEPSSHDAVSNCAPVTDGPCCSDGGCCAPEAPAPAEEDCDGPCVEQGSPPADTGSAASAPRPFLATLGLLSAESCDLARDPGTTARAEATESPPDVLGASSRLRL